MYLQETTRFNRRRHKARALFCDKIKASIALYRSNNYFILMLSSLSNIVLSYKKEFSRMIHLISPDTAINYSEVITFISSQYRFAMSPERASFQQEEI